MSGSRWQKCQRNREVTLKARKVRGKLIQTPPFEAAARGHITAIPHFHHPNNHNLYNHFHLFLKNLYSNFNVHHNHLEGFWKHRMLGPIPRVSDSAGLRSGPRIFISNKSSVALMQLVQAVHQIENYHSSYCPRLGPSGTDIDSVCLCGDTDGRTCHLVSCSKDEVDSPATLFPQK